MNSPQFNKTLMYSSNASDFFFFSSSEKKEQENQNKENLDPFSKMITPLKQKTQKMHESSSNRNTNRSPLQDITPLDEKKSKESQVKYNNLQLVYIYICFFIFRLA